jgi:hypothetical protein
MILQPSAHLRGDSAGGSEGTTVLPTKDAIGMQSSQAALHTSGSENDAPSSRPSITAGARRSSLSSVSLTKQLSSLSLDGGAAVLNATPMRPTTAGRLTARSPASAAGRPPRAPSSERTVVAAPLPLKQPALASVVATRDSVSPPAEFSGGAPPLAESAAIAAAVAPATAAATFSAAPAGVRASRPPPHTAVPRGRRASATATTPLPAVTAAAGARAGGRPSRPITAPVAPLAARVRFCCLCD